MFGCACFYWLFALQPVPLEVKDLGSYHRQLFRLGYYEYLLKVYCVESLVISISAMSVLWKVLCLLKSQEDISFNSFNLDTLFWSLHSPSLLYWFISILTLLHLYSCMWLRFCMQCRWQFRRFSIAEFPAVQVEAQFAFSSLKDSSFFFLWPYNDGHVFLPDIKKYLKDCRKSLLFT